MHAGRDGNGAPRRLPTTETAFALAHSVTLVLATLGVLTPPASIIEPVIALSIVMVGMHGRLLTDQAEAAGKRQDLRLGFALGFGLMHGFGLAFVLREL